MATFAGTCYVLFMTQLLYCHAVALIVIEKSDERQIATTIYSLRTCVENMVSQIFKKAQNVAYHACKADASPDRSRRGDRSPGQAGSRLRDQLGPQGISYGSTPGSARVRRAG